MRNTKPENLKRFLIGFRQASKNLPADEVTRIYYHEGIGSLKNAYASGFRFGVQIRVESARRQRHLQHT